MYKENNVELYSQLENTPVQKPMFNSVFDVPINGVNGEPMFLKQFEGKVLVFVNTTGMCGNAPQWPILDEIQEEYKDKNVQVIYVPTNDYCGSVTFEEYKDGIKDGKASEEYAKRTYNIDAPFTELVSSRNTPWEYKVHEWDGENLEWMYHPDKVHTLEQVSRHPLYQFLIPESDYEPIGGNFHKFITNSQGLPVAEFSNTTFFEGDFVTKHTNVLSRAEEVANFKAVLDEVLLTGECTNPRYRYAPYSQK